MRINMPILAESISATAFLSPTAESPEMTISGVCPLASWDGEGHDDLLFAATEEEARHSAELPRHLAVLCERGTGMDHLETLCRSLAEDDHEVMCVTGMEGVPGFLLRTTSVLSRYQAWDDRLLSAIMRGADVQEVLSIGAEELKNPIALFDSASVLVAHAGTLPVGWERSVWKDVIGRGFVPMEHYSATELLSFQRMLGETRDPIVNSPSKGHGETELTCTIEVGGCLFAMLAQVDLSHPFSPAQRSLVSHVRDRMETMYLAQAHSKGRRDELAHCLRMILVGRPQDPSVTRFHLRAKAWSENDVVRVVRIPLSQDTAEAGRAEAHLSRARITFPKAVALVHDETVVLACRESDYPHDALVRQLEKLSREMETTIAVSDAFPGIALASVGYQQCILALEVARTQGLQGVIPFEHAVIPALIETIASRGIAEELIDPRIGALVNEPHGDELVHNLFAYLICGCNAAKASKRLFMHRNTLDYRIERVEKITGFALADLSEDEVLRLLISSLLVSNSQQQ